MASPAIQRYANDAARIGAKYGIPGNVLLGLADVETGGTGNPHLTSPKGARGFTQFMPGTRQEIIQRYKVDPWHGPRSALVATALYLRDLGARHDLKHALAAYNGGPRNPQYGYAAEVLKRAAGYRSGGAVSGAPTRAGGPASPATVLQAGQPSSGLTGAQSGVDVASLLSALKSQPQLPQATAPPLPQSLDARRFLQSPGGYQPPPPSQPATSPSASLAEQIQALSQLRGPDIPKAATQTLVIPGQPGTAGAPGRRLGRTIVGSPVPGQKPHGATHETAGLPGYPAFDYMAPAGTAVVAPVSGKIIRLSGHDPRGGPTSGPHGPFGWSIYLQGDNGKTYFLTHLGRRNVRVGQRVGQGTQIGAIGNYAKWGGADHVHVGVHG